MSDRQPRSPGAPDGSPWVEIADVAAWQGQALCRGLGAELFFPAGEICAEGTEHAAAAKAICGTCPVRCACLEFSLTTNQEYGIWGGLTEWERRPLLRARQRAQGHRRRLVFRAGTGRKSP